MLYPTKTLVLSKEAAHQDSMFGTFVSNVQRPPHKLFSFNGQHWNLRNTSFFCEKKHENCLKRCKSNEKHFWGKMSFVLSISAIDFREKCCIFEFIKTLSMYFQLDTKTLFQIFICTNQNQHLIFAIFLFKNFCMKAFIMMKVRRSYIFQSMMQKVFSLEKLWF